MHLFARGNLLSGNPPVEQSTARASDRQAQTPHPLMTGTDTQGSGGRALLVVKYGTLAMSIESWVSVSVTPVTKLSEATEQVVEEVEMADNLSLDSDGSLVPSAGLSTRQIKRRRQKAKKAEALAKEWKRESVAELRIPLTLPSSGNETGSVPTTGKRRKAKKRKVEKRKSEMPASSTQCKADKSLPEKAKAKGSQMSNDTLTSTSGELFVRMAAKAMTVEIHTDKEDGLLSKRQEDYLDSYL